MTDPSTPTTHVFVGPSLPHAEVRRILPTAQLHPPVRHGDLARLDARPGDTVLIIDGLFLHSAAVRHKEILTLLADGVSVAGAGSMGALRAVELSPFGMHGVGQIFDLYHHGVIDGDDEVAIVHGDHESEYRPLSEPMVNIRLDLTRARDAGVLNAEAHDLLLATVKSWPFRQRSLAGLNRAAHLLLAGPDADMFTAWLSEHHVDSKARDARTLLNDAAHHATTFGPPDDELTITPHDTVYGAGWTFEFGGRMVDGRWITHADAVALVALCDPDFPRRFRTAVLATMTTDDPAWRADDPDPVAAVDTAAVEACAVNAARTRGLLGSDDELADSCHAWLTMAEQELPAEEAVLRVLVRAYGCRPAAQCGIMPRLLPADAKQWYRRAAAVAGFADLTLGRRSAGSTGGARLAAAAVDRFCAESWGCAVADLPMAAADRGFPSLEHARRAAGDLAVHARWFATEPVAHQPASTVGSHP